MTSLFYYLNRDNQTPGYCSNNIRSTGEIEYVSEKVRSSSWIKVCQEFNFSNQECFLNGCNYFSLCSILIRLVILFLLAILFYISILSYKTDKVHRNASYKAEATTFSLFSCYFPEEARHVALVYYLLRTTTELTFHRRPPRQLRWDTSQPSSKKIFSTFF